MAYGSINSPTTGSQELEELRVFATATNENAIAALDRAKYALAVANAAKAAADNALNVANNAKINADKTKMLAEAARDAVEDYKTNIGASPVSSNTINIIFDPEFIGKQYTVTGGSENKTGTVPDSCKDSVTVVGKNTIYTISSVVDDVTYSDTVTTGSEFGVYVAILTMFNATISVSTIAGSTVEAVCGGLRYTATADNSGLASVVVKKAGQYMVSAKKGSKVSTDVAVDVAVNGGSYSAIIKFAIADVPSQSGNLAYTGNPQSPSWSNFDGDELTISGSTSGTDAGNYVVTFTPKAGYQWGDGTVTSKNVTWTISKASGSLSIIPTTLSLSGSLPSGTIEVSKAGNGAITATSSDITVATVYVVGSSVKVEAVAEGSATITVSVSEGTNHSAPADKTCSVTVSGMKASASPTPKSGVTYTDGISDLTVDQLAEFAEAISNNADITSTNTTVYVDKGSVHRKIRVGDTVPVSINSENHFAQVMGFNHYELTDAAAYGKATVTGKAGILFQTKHCLKDDYYMMPATTRPTDGSGWPLATLRTQLQGNIKDTLSTPWQNTIKTVKRMVSISSGSKYELVPYDIDDTLFLPNAAEVYADAESREYSLPGESNDMYAYYKAGNSRLTFKYGSDSVVVESRWLASAYKGNSYAVGLWCRTNWAGITTQTKGWHLPIAPCWCI